MSLAEEYVSQERWRRWNEAIERVPVRSGQTVLDLGCGVGQVAARFQALGARAIGIDANDELLAAARARHPGVRFETGDVADLRGFAADGIWSSFVAAYLPDLEATLRRWREILSPGGWIALVEADDLLGHGPVPPDVAADVKRFYAAAPIDFERGRKMAGALRRTGFEILQEGDLPDDELSFDGPAPPEVLEAWRRRFERMVGLRRFFGDRAAAIERAILEALASASHRSAARVVIAVGRRQRD